MNDDIFLDFEIRTTHFLGEADVAREIVKHISKLPKEFWPTKCEDSNFKKKPFSFNCPDEFISMVPGSFKFEGHSRVYKINQKFELTVFWAKGSQDWFNSNPAKKFNSICLSYTNAKEIISSPKVFDTLKCIWLELCIKFNAAYAYCYLDKHATANPRGEGYCLQRLHWKTFFGREYIKAFNINQSMTLMGADIKFFGDDAALISLNSSALDLIKPNENEWRVIEQLGNEYFWGYVNDDWRNPKAIYKVPNFNWKNIIT